MRSSAAEPHVTPLPRCSGAESFRNSRGCDRGRSQCLSQFRLSFSRHRAGAPSLPADCAPERACLVHLRSAWDGVREERGGERSCGDREHQRMRSIHRGGELRAGAGPPSCCSFRKTGSGAPHPPNQNLGVLRSAHARYDRHGRSGLAQSSSPVALGGSNEYPAHQHGDPAMSLRPPPRWTSRT
jgi:hypothetical protein